MSANEPEFFYDIEQNSTEWFELRCGIPTASNFSAILAKGEGKTRAKYMRHLAGEIVTNNPRGEIFRTDAMDRGKEMEPEAHEWYERRYFVDLKRVGFVRRKISSGRFVGCSPDSLLDGKLIEIKTQRPDILIETMEAGVVPRDHMAQVQGSMWIAGLASCDLVIFYRGMPPLVFNIKRDENYIAILKKEVDAFDFELHQMVKWVREKAA